MLEKTKINEKDAGVGPFKKQLFPIAGTDPAHSFSSSFHVKQINV